MEYKVVSLFSGAGGLDLGFHHAGFHELDVVVGTPATHCRCSCLVAQPHHVDCCTHSNAALVGCRILGYCTHQHCAAGTTPMPLSTTTGAVETISQLCL